MQTLVSVKQTQPSSKWQTAVTQKQIQCRFTRVKTSEPQLRIELQPLMLCNFLFVSFLAFRFYHL